jgi:hypothetical protein
MAMWGLLLTFVSLKTVAVLSAPCSFQVGYSNTDYRVITYPHRFNPLPSLTSFKFCHRYLVSQEECDLIEKNYYHSCLGVYNESEIDSSSSIDLLYFLSFDNQAKLRYPINLNSLISPQLPFVEFIETITSNVDNNIYTSPRDSSARDLSSSLRDYYLLSFTLDYTDPHGAFLEFGSDSGSSTRVIEQYFLSHPSHYHARVYGFDSFHGLPENWRTGYPAGKFDHDGLPPYPETQSIKWKVGLFNETVPSYFQSLAESVTPLSFLHIDCDLYSSSALILSSLLQYSDQLLLSSTSCTLLLFNELIDYSTFEEHEIKAFYEFAQAVSTKYRHSHHIVIEMLPRTGFVNPESVSFRLCFFPKLDRRPERFVIQ